MIEGVFQVKYKVGDKVRYKHKKSFDNVEVGEVGTICGFSEVTGEWGVAFETKDVYKHSCSGLCNDNYGWWCDENALEPVISTLAEIKENNLRCVIKVDSKEEAVKLFEIFNPNDYDVSYIMVNYWKGNGTYCFHCCKPVCNGEKLCPECLERAKQHAKIARTYIDHENHPWRGLDRTDIQETKEKC